jgi:hypothetical protein
MCKLMRELAVEGGHVGWTGVEATDVGVECAVVAFGIAIRNMEIRQQNLSPFKRM